MSCSSRLWPLPGTATSTLAVRASHSRRSERPSCLPLRAMRCERPQHASQKYMEPRLDTEPHVPLPGRMCLPRRPLTRPRPVLRPRPRSRGVRGADPRRRAPLLPALHPTHRRQNRHFLGILPDRQAGGQAHGDAAGGHGRGGARRRAAQRHKIGGHCHLVRLLSLQHLLSVKKPGKGRSWRGALRCAPSRRRRIHRCHPPACPDLCRYGLVKSKDEMVVIFSEGLEVRFALHL